MSDQIYSEIIADSLAKLGLDAPSSFSSKSRPEHISSESYVFYSHSLRLVASREDIPSNIWTNEISKARLISADDKLGYLADPRSLPISGSANFGDVVMIPVDQFFSLSPYVGQKVISKPFFELYN